MTASAAVMEDALRSNDVPASDVVLTRARVAVVILNYRTPQLVIDCIRSLLSEIDTTQDRVVVVDNCSADGSSELLERELELNRWGGVVQLLAAKENKGFSAGNNIGIEHQSADYYWLMNSDTLARPGALQALLTAISTDERIGAVGPALIWPTGDVQQSRFRYHSPWSELLQSAQLRILSKLLGWTEQAPATADAVRVCDDSTWVSFASVLLRNAAVQTTGLMDDGYFMYFEDMDYCRRLQSAGWKIVYAATAHVVHLRGGSSPVKSIAAQCGRRPRYYYASRTRYITKFYSRLGLVVANSLWWCGRAISLPRDLLRVRQPTACRYEWLDIWTNSIHPLSGRNR